MLRGPLSPGPKRPPSPGLSPPRNQPRPYPHLLVKSQFGEKCRVCVCWSPGRSSSLSLPLSVSDGGQKTSGMTEGDVSPARQRSGRGRGVGVRRPCKGRRFQDLREQRSSPFTEPAGCRTTAPGGSQALRQTLGVEPPRAPGSSSLPPTQGQARGDRGEGDPSSKGTPRDQETPTFHDANLGRASQPP